MRAVLFFFLAVGITMSQESSPPPKPLDAIEDVPGLPRVLLIGDSISIGYTLPVRALLEGVANVHRPPVNCGPTLRGLEHLDSWLGDASWDVIHFNWGLHDLKHIDPAAEPRHSASLVPVSEGEHMVSPENYGKNLGRLVERLQRTGAALTWCSTTPVPEGARGRVPGDAQRYNEVAEALMRREGIPINDLYTFAAARAEALQLPADVHFSPEGSEILAEQVTRAIIRQLPIKAQVQRALTRLPALETLPPHPELPALLPETVPPTAEWPRLRTDYLDQLAHYEYGFAPASPNRLRFQVVREDHRALGGKAVKREVRVHFGPLGTPPMDLLLYVPKKINGPAPVFLGLNFHGNQTVTSDPEVTITPNWVPDRGAGVENNRATEASRGTNADRWPLEAIIDRGYAVATVYHGDLDPDLNDPSDGIQPHLTGDLPSEALPHQWGSLRAWAYGLSRAANYLAQASDIDPERIAVMGHSRNGKTALVAGAFDDRFSLVISNQSGCGGAALSRRRHGETVKRINDVFPHWFNGAFKAFNEREEYLPMDQHTLLAAIAPRPLLICSATGDDWADPEGEFLAAKEASAVYEWLGEDHVGEEKYPEENQLLNRRVGYHRRPGPHGIGLEDWTVFMDFADRQWSPTQP